MSVLRSSIQFISKSALPSKDTTSRLHHLLLTGLLVFTTVLLQSPHTITRLRFLKCNFDHTMFLLKIWQLLPSAQNNIQPPSGSLQESCVIWLLALTDTSLLSILYPGTTVLFLFLPRTHRYLSSCVLAGPAVCKTVLLGLHAVHFFTPSL